MFFILEPADAVSGFPGMHQDFRILRLIANRARQPAMIFMRVRKDDPANIGDANTSFSQAFMQGVIRFFGFRAGVDERNRIFRDQVDVNRADVEGRGKRDGNDAHVACEGRRLLSIFELFEFLEELLSLSGFF